MRNSNYLFVCIFVAALLAILALDNLENRFKLSPFSPAPHSAELFVREAEPTTATVPSSIRSFPTPTPKQRATTRPTPKPWHLGGTLHNASVDRWNDSTQRNRLATAYDWVMVEFGWDDETINPEMRAPLRNSAQHVVDCIDRLDDELTAKQREEPGSVTFLAALCTNELMQ